MAISFVGSATGTNSIASMPSHQAGDLLLFFAFRDGNNTPPSLPSGKTSIATHGGSNASMRLGYLVATGSSETSGIWTNASKLICHVYRGTNGIGDSNTDGDSGDLVTYPALTLVDGGGNSWVAGFVGGRETSASFETPPTGMTNRSNVVDGENEVAGHDTNGGVSSWSSADVDVGGSDPSGWASAVVEILAGGATVEADQAESATISSAASASVVRQAVITESAAITDSALASIVRSASMSESIIISGSPSADRVRRGDVTESATVTDTAGAFKIKSPDISESASISETVGSSLTVSADQAESVSIGETVTGSSAARIAESLSVDDAMSTTMTINADQVESASILDAVDSTLTVNADQSESASISNAQDAYMVKIKQMAESLSITEEEAAYRVKAAAQAESAGITEVQLSTLVRTAQQQESAAITDTISTLMVKLSATVESASIGDSVEAHGVIVSGDISESLSIAESVAVGAITYGYHGAPDIMQIIHENHFDSATNSASSEASGFEVENAEIDTKRDVLRTADLAELTITSTWAAAKTISGVALAFTNLMAGSTMRVRLYTETSDPSPVFDSSDQALGYAYPNPKGFDTIGLLSLGFGGGSYASLFFEEYAVKKCVISVNSSGNPDGYMEVGRVIIGQSWEPAHNPDYGLELSEQDATLKGRLECGDQEVKRGTVAKQISFDLSYLKSADKQKMSELIRYSGEHSPIFISVLPAETGEMLQAYQIYGRMKAKNSLVYKVYNAHNTVFDIEEI